MIKKQRRFGKKYLTTRVLYSLYLTKCTESMETVCYDKRIKFALSKAQPCLDPP